MRRPRKPGPPGRRPIFTCGERQNATMNVDTDIFNAIIDERDQLQSEVTVLRAFVSTIAETVTELGDHLAAWEPALPGRTRNGQGRHAPPRGRHLHVAR